MAELIDAIKLSKPDGFVPTIVKQTEDYVYVEYQSPFFGRGAGPPPQRCISCRF